MKTNGNEFQYETPVGTYETWEAATAACERCDLDAVGCVKAVRVGAVPAVAAPAIIIVVARLVEDSRLVKAGQIDIGKPHIFETYMRPEACMWANEGSEEDLRKAQEWAGKNGYRALVYAMGENDPLGRARKDIAETP